VSDAKLSDCTCEWNPKVRGSRERYPCPLHGYVYATKTQRIELLEERVSRLESGDSQTAIARDFDVSASTVSYVVNGKYWR
jgi:hypothetical protein